MAVSSTPDRPVYQNNCAVSMLNLLAVFLLRERDSLPYVFEGEGTHGFMGGGVAAF